MRKLSGMLLVFILIITMLAPVQAMDTQPNGAAITPGKALVFKEALGTKEYTFTPSAAGWYRFYSYDLELGDPMGEIKDQDGNVIVENDDVVYENDNKNFDIQYYLEGGQQYTFRILEYKGQYYQFKVKLEKMATMKITLMANGGVFRDDSTTMTLDVRTGITLKQFRDLYEEAAYAYHEDMKKGFSGWSDSANGELLPDDYVLKSGSKLYALWDTFYSITLHGCGGYTMDYDDETGDEHETETFRTIALNGTIFGNEIYTIFEREGYYFLGWGEYEGAKEPIDPFSYKITKEADFYAIWLEPGKDAKPLTEDTPAAASGYQFSFTPAKTGYYSFISYAEEKDINNDPRGYLYDSKGELIASMDDSNGYNFRINVKLEAGKTYYLITSTFSGSVPNYNIAVHAAQKVILDGNGGAFSSGGEDEENEKEVIEAWIHQPWELSWLKEELGLDNRTLAYGWAFSKEAEAPEITPDTDISEVPEGTTLYAVWRKWNEYSFEKTLAGKIEVPYTGEAQTPEISLYYGMEKLMPGTDFEVTGYEDNVEVGTACAALKGLGRFAGQEKKVTFEITPQSLEKAKVTGIKTKTYTGKQIKQSKLKVTLDGVVLINKADYTVTYKNNKAAGKATLTITGIGKYTGTIEKTFKIKPKATAISSVKNSAKKTVTLKWKKAASGTGYQIQYAQKKNFKGKKTVTVSKLKTTSKKIKKLKKGKTYYFRLRVYKKVGKSKLYSKWSAVKKVKIKK